MNEITVEFDQQDVDNFKKLLVGLPSDIQRKVIRQSVRKSAEIVLQRAQALAPVGYTARLVESLLIKTYQEKSGDDIGALVFARETGSGGGWYAHLVEFGSRVVVKTRAGKQVVGFQPARPFLRPALEENIDKVVKLMGQDIARRVNSITRRRARKK